MTDFGQRPSSVRGQLLGFLVCTWLHSATAYSDDETWTLNFEASETSVTPIGKMEQVSKGKLHLRLDTTGKLTGSGGVEVKTTITGRLSATLSGKKKIQVKGQRDEQHLIFSFSGSIPLKGTAKTGGITIPMDLTVDARGFALKQKIERREGATAQTSLKDSGVNARRTYKLSNGKNVQKINEGGDKGVKQKPAEPLPDLAKDTPEWTLEFTSTGKGTSSDPNTDLTVTVTMRGSLPFSLPWTDAPVKGSGIWKGTWLAKATRPRPFENKYNLSGKLVLDGHRKKGNLVFRPKGDVTSGQGKNFQNQPGIAWDRSAEVQIEIKDGGTSSQSISHKPGGMPFSGRVTWKLRGKRRELWRITIDQYNAHSVSPFTAASGFGLKVTARTTVDALLEENRFLRGKGTRSLKTIESYSKPAGVWHSKSIRRKLPRGTTPFIINQKFQMRSGSVSGTDLILTWRDGFYGVAWQSTIDVQAAKRAFGVEWDRTHRDRKYSLGPHEVTRNFDASVYVPLRDGASIKKGKPSSINYEAITIQRLLPK